MKTEKSCTNCGVSKPLTEFYRTRARKDGLHSWCKKCANAYRHTESGRVAVKKWNTSPGGKVSQRGRRIRFREKYPDKYHAHMAVTNAITAERMEPANTQLCSCKNPGDQYHHHKGYAREHWLDVIVTCRKCHVKLDRVA